MKTFYVDNNYAGPKSGALGSATNPFTTIQKGADVAKAGDIVMVDQGTYKENVKLRNSGNEADGSIRFVSEDGVGAAIIQPLVTTKDTIAIGGTDYVSIEGFKILGPNSTMHAIQIYADTNNGFNPAHHVSIIDNLIVAGKGDGIKGSKSEYLTIDGNIITQASFAQASGEAGIDFVGVNHSTITDNQMLDLAFMGLMIKGGSHDLKIDGNTIDGTGKQGVEIGGYTENKFYWPGTVPPADWEAKDIEFTNNTIRDTGGTALRFIGAKNVVVEGNDIDSDSQYLVTVDDSAKFHPKWESENIRFWDNEFSREDWLVNRSTGDDIGMADGSSVQADYWFM